MRRFFYLTISVFLLTSRLLWADSVTRSVESPEDFRIELTGSAWLTGPTGNIRADGTPVDFVSDLGLRSEEPRFYGRLIFKPGRKHRLILEGSPLSFSGSNTIERSFVFLNRTYNVSQTVATKADISYAFAGYQYDALSGPLGHLGLQVGAAYLGLQGTLHGIESGITETKNVQAPLPLIGTEFRLFPIPHHRIVQLEGMLRGLPAGGYGYFLEGGASGGLRYGPISVLAGYRDLFADVHQESGLRNGAAIHVKGPIFSLQGQW